MRLIDADKIVYMWKQDINGDFHDGVTLESIVDKTPTENVNALIAKELEKIKAEFEDRILLNQTVAIQIIDRHISELKGENK